MARLDGPPRERRGFSSVGSLTSLAVLGSTLVHTWLPLISSQCSLSQQLLPSSAARQQCLQGPCPYLTRLPRAPARAVRVSSCPSRLLSLFSRLLVGSLPLQAQPVPHRLAPLGDPPSADCMLALCAMCSSSSVWLALCAMCSSSSSSSSVCGLLSVSFAWQGLVGGYPVGPRRYKEGRPSRPLVTRTVVTCLWTSAMDIVK
jgi:hypothetical protein